MSYSNKIAVFATIPVTVDFIVSGLLTNGAVMHLQFLFREPGSGRRGSFDRVMIWVIAEVKDSFSLQVEYCSGHTFYSDYGFYNGGRRSVYGRESCQWGSGEGGVLFSLCLLWAGGVGEKDVIKGGIALSFDKEIGVFVQLSFNLLGHESVLL